MLSKEKLAVLLGRSLTTAEDTNFDSYLNIATERLEELLCIDLTKDDDADRIFETRSGYRTVYIDLFTEINSVTADGETVDDDNYTKKQNDRFTGNWFNIVEFDSKQKCERITVNADWGFAEDEAPEDLLLLLAQLFNQISVDQKTDGQVQSKRIEDYSVTYKDSTTMEELVNSNRSVIDKYSQCNQGVIRHGRVHAFRHY